jgi:hypothetical protein
MTHDEHRKRHIDLHRALDQLIADYMAHHPVYPTSYLDMPLRELVEWSMTQTGNPTELPK